MIARIREESLNRREEFQKESIRGDDSGGVRFEFLLACAPALSRRVIDVQLDAISVLLDSEGPHETTADDDFGSEFPRARIALKVQKHLFHVRLPLFC